MSTSQQSLHDLIIGFVNSREVALPIFNPVALRLQQALNRDDIQVAEIESMIAEDQVLASQILRVANAAFYQGLQPVTTVRKAVIRLGMQKVAGLAMVAAQQQMYQKTSASFQKYQEKLWRHAFASAMGSRWIAEHCGFRSIAENAFIAGLLHNIGQLALLKIIADLYGAGLVPANLPQAVIAEILNGPMHAEQGHLIVRKWNLPDEYCVVVRDHHKEPYDPGNVLLIFVRLIDHACDKIGIGLRGDPQIALAATPEAQALGLGEIALAEMEIFLEDSAVIAGKV